MGLITYPHACRRSAQKISLQLCLVLRENSIELPPISTPPPLRKMREHYSRVATRLTCMQLMCIQWRWWISITMLSSFNSATMRSWSFIKWNTLLLASPSTANVCFPSALEISTTSHIGSA